MPRREVGCELWSFEIGATKVFVTLPLWFTKIDSKILVRNTHVSCYLAYAWQPFFLFCEREQHMPNKPTSLPPRYTMLILHYSAAINCFIKN
jgi:hypothetical protein